MKIDIETLARRVLLAVCVIGFVKYGSTKPTWGRVTVQNADAESRYLVDNGSYVTNSHVHVSLTRSPLLPDTADFYGYWRRVGSTNDAEWAQFLDTTIGSVSFPTNIAWAEAHSNDYIFGTSYVRSQTHTNGVAQVNWVLVPGSTNSVVPVRTSIYLNNERKK